MTFPTTREEFKQKVLRSLGAPVIKIEVDDEQLEDRIDDALNLYWEYHFDGYDCIYYKHQVTETDKTNGYITVPEEIRGVIELIDIQNYLGYTNWDSAGYQLLYNYNTIYGWEGISLSSYYMTLQKATELQDFFIGAPLIRFNKHRNRVYIDNDWERYITDDFIILKAYEVIDPATYADVWKDRWLFKYVAAIVKKQWGQNLSKFEGMSLPGNVQFNGAKILDDAIAEIRELEEAMIDEISLPLNAMTG